MNPNALRALEFDHIVSVLSDLAVTPTGRNALDALHPSTDPTEADCMVSGRASDIYFALWNRADASRLTISGRREVFDLFRTRITIKWS